MESAFLPRLSGGLAARLSEVTVEIGPLDREGMIAVIVSPSIIDTAAETAAAAFQPPPAAPFQAPASSTVEPAPEASIDRVDDLLRQFRERYGKS